MKFIIRRALLGIITVPIALTAYGLIYFTLGLLAPTDTLGVIAFTDNLWSVGISWVLVVTFARQLIDLANKITA
jgi:hypothetical protein